MRATTTRHEGLDRYELPGGCAFFTGKIPARLFLDDAAFEALWSLHPSVFHTITIHGRDVETPRWQQAYGHDYRYTGRTNAALPLPNVLEPLRAWCCDRLDHRLNGVLVNWYDASRKHYLGAHRDSAKDLVPDAPIVTVSFGERRKFRLRPWMNKAAKMSRPAPGSPRFLDLDALHGSVFVMPAETNRRWTHEVPFSTSQRGLRISISMRAFTD